MNTIKNRYEFMTVLSASMCNPNGDPDAGNAPRTDMETGIGFISDVAIKRWIRNYVEYAYAGESGMRILMTNGANLNKKIAEAVLTVNETTSTDNMPKDKKKNPFNKKVSESADYMCNNYWDCRTFGGVLSTGLNAGQIRGAVQIEMPISKDPVQISDLSITRMCYADAKDCKTVDEYEKAEAEMPDSKKRTMGDKQIISFGLYILKGTISAAFAEKVGFTDRDLEVLCEALVQMLPHNVSSSKSGMRLEAPIILFKHVGTQGATNEEQRQREAKLGCVPAQMLFDLLKISKKNGVKYPRSAADYDMKFDLSSLPDGVQVGFKLLPFEDFTWGDDIRAKKYNIEIE